MPFWALIAGCESGDAPSESADSAAPCAPADAAVDATCACDAPGLEVGGGSDGFVAVAEGAAATIVHGPQGGWHVLGSALMTNVGAIVTIHYTVTVAESGTIVSDNTYRVQMVKNTACEGFYPGMYGYLDVSALASGESDTPPELLANKELILEMSAEDIDGRAATDTLTVIGTLDASDE